MADQPKPPRCFMCDKLAIGAHVYSTKLKALADSDFKRFFYCTAHEQQAIPANRDGAPARVGS